MGIDTILLRPTWIEVDYDSLLSNIRRIQNLVGNGVHLIPVVKGNAYGCGLPQVVRLLDGEAIYGFGTGNIYEALEIRKLSSRPVLLFGNTLPNAIPEILEHGITPSISDWEWVSLYSTHAHAEVPVFVKVDVGGNRLGVPLPEAVTFIENVSRLPYIRIEGIHTHISGPLADNGIQEFMKVTSQLEERGVRIPIKLAANSELTVRLPSAWLNAVNPGKLVYGILPTESGAPAVKPVFTKLASRIILIKKPSAISLEKFDRIGVIPIGFADGLPSSFVKGSNVLIHGKRAPIIKVHAEHTRVDLGAVPEAGIGDEVVLIGGSGTDHIAASAVASKCGMTESELLRNLARCLPSICREGGRSFVEFPDHRL